MDEVRTRIIAHPAILQLEGHLPDFARTDTGDEEVDGLSFDMQTMSGGTTASFDEKGIVLR